MSTWAQQKVEARGWAAGEPQEIAGPPRQYGVLYSRPDAPCRRGYGATPEEAKENAAVAVLEGE